MSEVISKVLPIILLTLAGLLIKRMEFLSEETIAGIKKLVLNVCLPSTLFLTFLNLEFQREYILLIFLMLVLFFLLYLTGGLVGRLLNYRNILSSFFSTGFSFGLVGIPLFIIMFGAENMGLYSIMGLSHEIFIWFIYYPVLAVKLRGDKGERFPLVNLLKSPLNISILLGVILNLAGLKEHFYYNPLLAGTINTLGYLGGINAPLILICIGYGMNLDRAYMAESMKLALVRVVTTFTTGYAFKFVLLDRLIKADRELFAYSFFALIVLPPLLSLPLFLSRYGEKRGEQLVSNATVQCTIVSMMLFIAYNILKAV